MLTLQDVTITRGADPLIEHAELAVFKKNTIGLLGSNGCGKSSLFAAILGDLELAYGDVQINKGTRIMSLAQEVPGLSMSVLDYTISGDTELFHVLEKLKHAEASDDYDTATDCHTQLYEMDGYSTEARAAKILRGLGFSQEEVHQPVSDFSGGWRMRMNLAKCLFAPSDLLLLDEPTNHLDMEAIIWLEKFLKHYDGGILLISHDQDFLDHTVTHIAHVENKGLIVYTGNYSSFEKLRAQNLALQAAQYKKQQAQIAHAMKFVDRFRSKASKSKQAQSRLKSIEKIDLVAAVYARLPFQFHFFKPEGIANPMLSMQRVSLGYDDQAILEHINLNIMSGQRIGLLGLNGAGKSTLIKGLCGELPPQSGTIERPAKLIIGYFAQHQVDHLPLDASALSLIKALDKNKTEKECLSYLGRFLFGRDQALAPLKHFSGGEKSRLALALIIWQRPNLLLLDEPTNHLDLEMRQALTFALQEYEGAMILVSHDRHLMRTLVEELYLIKDGKVERFDGTVEDYEAM